MGIVTKQLAAPATLGVALLASAILASPAAAINIIVDYSYDATNFFGSGNPDGPAAGELASSALEAAAAYFSDIFDDSFAEIRTPDPYVGSQSTQTWTWNLSFTNPSGNNSITLYDQVIGTNEYRVYAGAKAIPGATLGFGGPGGWGWSGSTDGPGYTPNELVEVQAISEAFGDAVATRGQPDGFARWGGAVAFDRSAGANWHYDHQSLPGSGQSDFFSVALHEMAHALGLGASENWNNWVSGSTYVGAAAVAQFGGPVPLDCSDGCGHWAEGVESTVFGTSTAQEAALDPTLTSGKRKLLTVLDAAAATDIGWTVVVPSFAPEDYNRDGLVNAADAAQWQGDYGVNADSDANGDGLSGGIDLVAWQRALTSGTAVPTVWPVPEPSVGVLIALLVCGYAASSGRICAA